MTVTYPFIHVSTSHHSHICYGPRTDRMTIDKGPLSNERFLESFGDTRQRATAHHLNYEGTKKSGSSPSKNEMATADASSPSRILLTDKTCSLVALYWSRENNAKKHTAITLAEACLPRTIARIYRGDIRPQWRRPYTPANGSAHSSPQNQLILGIIVDDIVGICTDGTIYAFSLLTLEARRVLRLIQNLIAIKRSRDEGDQHTISHPNLGPLLEAQDDNNSAPNGRVIRVKDIDPGFDGADIEGLSIGMGWARKNWVDGDLVAESIENMCKRGLKALVEEDCVTEVKGLFLNGVKQLRGNVGVSGSGLSEDELFDWTEKWIGEVTERIL
jgi:hypothetical protein